MAGRERRGLLGITEISAIWTGAEADVHIRQTKTHHVAVTINGNFIYILKTKQIDYTQAEFGGVWYSSSGTSPGKDYIHL